MLVSDLSERMTAAEETMWMAYYKEQPFGDYRADVRSAQITQILHNSNVKKKDMKKLDDFILFKPKSKPDVVKQARDVFAKFKKLNEGLKT